MLEVCNLFFDSIVKTLPEFQKKRFTKTFEVWDLLKAMKTFKVGLDVFLHSEIAMNLFGTKSGRLWLKVMYLGIKLRNIALVMVYNDYKFD